MKEERRARWSCLIRRYRVLFASWQNCYVGNFGPRGGRGPSRGFYFLKGEKEGPNLKKKRAREESLQVGRSKGKTLVTNRLGHWERFRRGGGGGGGRLKVLFLAL